MVLCQLLYRIFQVLAVPAVEGIYNIVMGFPGGSDGKESACNAGNLGSIPESGRSPGEEMATHFSSLAWRIPWTEEPGRQTQLSN